MYLSRLQLFSAPGLPSGITLNELGPGLVLLLGPNASGKSTIGRTLRGALWPEHAEDGLSALSRWQVSEDGPPLEVTTMSGRTQWPASGVSIPPELAGACRLTLADMLQAQAGSDHTIAKKIQQQLDGGYDLLTVRPDSTRTRPKPSLTKAHSGAKARLRDLLVKTDELARQEQHLEKLNHQVQQAAGAAERRQQVRHAIKIQELRAEIGDLKAELATLPDGVDKLPVDVVHELESLSRAVHDAEQACREQQALLSSAEQDLAEVQFAEPAPTVAQVNGWHDAAGELKQLDDRLRSAVSSAAEARAQRDAAAGEVWGEPSGAERLDAKALERLQSAVDSAQIAAMKLETSVDEVVGAAPDRAHDRKLSDARLLLSRWLKSASKVASVPPSPSSAWQRLVLPVAVALLAVAVAVMVAGHVLAGAAMLAAGGAALGVWIGLRISVPDVADGVDPSAVVREQYTAAGHRPLEQWTPAAVSVRIDEIQAEIDDLADRRRVHAAREKQAQERRGWTKKHTEAQQALELCVRDLGLASDWAGLALIHQAKRLQALSEAEVALARAEQAREEAERAQQDKIRELQDWLRTVVPEATVPSTAQSILICMDDLRTRRQQVTDRSSRVKQCQTELRSADKAHGDAIGSRDAYLKKHGVLLSELDQLQTRSSQAEQARSLIAKRRTAEETISLLEPSLPDDLPTDIDSLRQEAERLEELDEKQSQLHESKAKIEKELADATSGDSIQMALAAREEAADALASNRDQERLAHAAHALINWVERERGEQDIPELLSRAREWFLAFTHNRYRLEVSGQRTFSAHDLHLDRRQSLSELSDGTRVQLLLAARMAWIEQQEGETKLPLFLDEVLATTDEERFAAISSAVLELVSSGRQVFYATSSPAEAHQWQVAAEQRGASPPQICRLGDPAETEDWTPPVALPEPTPRLPSAGELDAVSWCVTAGMARPGVFASVDAWPIALVLFDHLDAAVVASQQGYRTVAQHELLPSPLAADVLALARARVRAIRAALQGLRIGRSRPVPWPEVEASGAVSTGKVAAVREVHRQHGGNARAFCDAVGALHRWRKDKLSDLRAHLEDKEILDMRDRLDHDAVVLEAQGAVTADVAAGVLTLDDVASLVKYVADVVEIEV